MSAATTANLDPLAGLPADLRAMRQEFWDGLHHSEQRATCPQCGAGVPARWARGGLLTWWYVLHCGDVLQVMDVR